MSNIIFETQNQTHVYDKDSNRKITCCICGKGITYRESCNPAPFIIKDGARCCHKCDEGYVIPSRKDSSFIEFLHKEAEFCYGREGDAVSEVD